MPSLAGFTLLQVVPALNAGGVERTTLDIAQAVNAAGGRALVASAGGRLEPELRARGGELVLVPLDRKAPWTLLANAARLREVIARERVDLVHARSRAPAWSAWLAVRAARVAFVTTYAGVYNAHGPLKRLYNSVMARGDLVIANSGFTRDHLLRAHRVDAARVVTIPRGVDLAVFDPAAVAPERIAAVRATLGLAPADARPVLLCAGRLTRWKGQALAIEALAAAGVEAVLALAGDDQGRHGYAAELRALADRLGVGERVRLVGHLDDMPAAYLAADLVLAPSLEPEAFGRTAVEPQAMGRFVLAAAHGAPCETVLEGVGGRLVPAGDPGAWAAAIVESLDRPRGRAQATAARAHVVAHYSLAAMTKATLGVYARLWAGAPR